MGKKHCDHCANGSGVQEPATIEIRPTNFHCETWTALCDQHYQQCVDDAQEINAHEMDNFDGCYGFVTWEERPIKPTERVQNA